MEISIPNSVKPKTKKHIEKMYNAFGNETVFGRSDVMLLLGLTASPVSMLLKKLVQMEVIEPVAGNGKGKYRFKNGRG